MNGIATTYLYDGMNPIQEQRGASILANLLAGPNLDEWYARTEAGQSYSDLEPPKAERVPGAGELRDWLGKEISRINDVGAARKKASFIAPPQGLRERACAAVRSAVRSAYAKCDYRRSTSTWAGGNHSVEISMTFAGGESARGECERVWSSNGKWTGTDSSHTLRVSLRWRLDVERRGLAVIDGCLTLAASPLQNLREGEEAYTICYVRQGRGVALETSHAVAYRRNGGSWRKAGNLGSARRAAGQTSPSSSEAQA